MMNRVICVAVLATAGLFAPAAATGIFEHLLSKVSPEELKEVLGMDNVALSGVMKFSVPEVAHAETRKDQAVPVQEDKPKEPVVDAQQHAETVMEKPKYCNGLDCPEFSILSKTKDYEERLYKASNWVSTRLQEVSYKTASTAMFRRLFNYIDGNNEKKEKIAMTAPVITKLIPGPGPACKSDFIMSFYMAPSVKNPPTPDDKDVFFSSLPEQKVFVASFSGFAKEDDYVQHAKALGEILQKEGKAFNDTVFYSAGYDSPFKFLNRHNEVWLIENGK